MNLKYVFKLDSWKINELLPLRSEANTVEQYFKMLTINQPDT